MPDYIRALKPLYLVVVALSTVVLLTPEPAIADSWECPAHRSGEKSLPEGARWLDLDKMNVVDLGHRKNQLLDYYCFGAYRRQFAAKMAEAKFFLEWRATGNPADKLALVLDVDETSLSGWPEMMANGFEFVDGDKCYLPDGPCELTGYQRMASESAFPPTLALYEAALSNNVTVFFITGRRDDQDGPNGTSLMRAATLRNLRNAGFHDLDSKNLFLRPPKESKDDVATVREFKQQERKHIEDDLGYKIIENVGDQCSDLGYKTTPVPGIGNVCDGWPTHSEKVFLLPNPFYDG